MTQKELEYFLSVYSSHSIKKSSEQLFVSSQALSKIIKNIEDELQVSLFTRTNQGLTPTHSADRLAEHAHIILNEFHNIISDFTLEKSTNSTVLTVASTYGVLDYLGYEFIRNFYIQYPNIKLNLVELPEKQICALLSANEVEIAFLPAPVDYSQYDAMFCFSWKHCLIINQNHPLAARKTITYSDLNGIPLALKGRSYSVFPSNISRFLKEGVNPDILLETTSDALIHQVADSNAGIGISLSFLAQKMHSKNTVIREFEDPNCRKEVYLVSKKNITKSADAVCFHNYLSEWLNTHN